MILSNLVKRFGPAVLVAFAIQGIGCSAVTSQKSNKYSLPSGREIIITSINAMKFENGETGLVLNYQTDIPIENLDRLRAEVEEVWTIFRYDVEKANTTSGIIRATHIEDDGMFVKNGKGYGFVFFKDAAGAWKLSDKK